jgi:hypothetical protein
MLAAVVLLKLFRDNVSERDNKPAFPRPYLDKPSLSLPSSPFGARSPDSFLSGIPDVEACHLAVSKAEDVFNRLVLQPVGLALKRLAFEIADGLPNLCDDYVVSSPVEAHRFDVRTDHAPLAGPVLAHGLATVNVAAIHAVGPGDIIGKHGQHAINIPRVEAVVDAFQDFDITVHRGLSSAVPVLRQGTEAICKQQLMGIAMLNPSYALD